MSLLSNVKEMKLPEHGYQYAEFKAIDGNYVISPSGARSFIANRYNWYISTIKKERTFTGNLASTVGSLMHQMAEDYHNGQLTVRGRLDSWKVKQIAKDYPEAIEEYERLADVFLDFLNEMKYPHSMEGYLQYEIRPNIWVCGSYDALECNGDGTYTLLDYKTEATSSKDLENHNLQLSIYSLLLGTLKGLTVTKLRIVQIVKTKTPKINVIEDIPNLEYAKKVLTEMVWAIDVAEKNPGLIELIFPDNIYDFSSDTKLGFNPTVVTHSEDDKKLEVAKNSIFS